jgi:hypothetical protein
MNKLNDSPQSGSGMLALFCDLKESDQSDFRPWLTEDLFPARVNIGFKNCASFDRMSGDGSEFVTLYEMPSLGYLYGEPYQCLRRQRNPRDAAYHEKFQNPERYTLSWTGPELSGSAAGFSSYIYVDRLDLRETNVQEFNMWFVGTYLPALAKIKNLVRVRRYLSMEGKQGHFILHEFEIGSVMENSVWLSMRSDIVGSTSALYKRVAQAP